jgi:hypothetical protein
VLTRHCYRDAATAVEAFVALFTRRSLVNHPEFNEPLVPVSVYTSS